MLRLLLSLILFMSTVACSFAEELQGGVQYDVDTARDYVQEGQVDTVLINGPYYFQDDALVKKKVYSYNNEGQVVGITVQYEKYPNQAFIYGKDFALKYMDVYDKSVDEFPHRGYRYDLQGKLILTSLSVSKNEHFRFSPSGELIAHSINGIIYDENGNQMGSASGN